MRRTTVSARHRRILKNYQLYLFLLPACACFLCFSYLPMYGVQIAFRNYKASRGFIGSEWVGLAHFRRFITSPNFWQYTGNTLKISVLTLVVGFPITIVFALLINEIQNMRAKKFMQTVTYAPHFVSLVVLVGMIHLFLDRNTGIVNRFLSLWGSPPKAYVTMASSFVPVYLVSGIWQNTGWNAVVFLSALAGIDPQLHESAVIDGATRIQRIRHINIPGIMPTISIMFILQAGKLMSVGYEKAFLLQNALNLQASEIISTYVYKLGLQKAQYSLSTAVGLMNSVINVALMLLVNGAVKRMGQDGLL